MRAAGKAKQHGFSLVAALFLIVVLAMLGVVAVKISASQQQTVDLSLLGARALSAANAGIEWGAYRALQDPSHACDASTAFTLTESALNGFVVTVTCTLTPENEQGSALHVYDFISTAQYGTYGHPDYVHRKVRGRFTHAP